MAHLSFVCQPNLKVIMHQYQTSSVHKVNTCNLLGGQLRVSHKGVSNFFDWGSSDSKAIQWAAFYSDCEHEIQEVTDGHRITLTYNLYFTQRTDATLQAFSSVDPQNFPFFKIAQAMLKNPDFLPEGKNCPYNSLT